MWSIHYQRRGVPGLRLVRELPRAIEHAFELLDQAVELRRIATIDEARALDLDDIGYIWRVYREQRTRKARG